jgi:hypothetical protein
MTITDVLDEPGIDIAAANVEEDLYTVPTGKNGLLRIRAANRDVGTAISIIVASGGAATDDTMFRAHETSIGDHDNWQRTFVVPEDAVVRVVSQALNVTFSVSGFLFTI